MLLLFGKNSMIINYFTAHLFVYLQSKKSTQTKRRKQEPGSRQPTKTNVIRSVSNKLSHYRVAGYICKA